MYGLLTAGAPAQQPAFALKNGRGEKARVLGGSRVNP